MLTSASWRRTTLRSSKLHRIWTTKTVHNALPFSTTRTSWWHVTAIYRHSMFCPKADKLHKHFNMGYTYLQWKQCHTEDWLVDIGTAANLSAESRTKLAQAKSKGLTHTLATEALTSGQCWDYMKDLLCLKICNSDIHTSVSCFMELQQKEKESLAACIHHFKWEAKRCNFTNSATTIRIFVKGLRNAHMLATQVYEKGPQALADAINEVKKPQAAQQLTATLIPSSTVNVMSHEEDHCFQCQESGHIAQYCPNVHCFECDEYRHIVVDCLHQIPPSKYTCMPSQTKIPYQTTAPDWLLATITRTGTDTADHGHSPIPIDTAATVTMIPTEAVPGHIIEIIDIIIGVLHDALTPVLIIPAMTPHLADCLHTGAHQLTLRTAAGHNPIQHTNQVRKPCTNLHPIPAELRANCMIKEIQESQ